MKSSFLLLLMSVIAASAIAEENQPDRSALAARVDHVARLVETSSAAHGVDDSANPEANSHHENARALVARARAALETQPELVSAMLDEAVREMLAATRESGANDGAGDKALHDFQDREESVLALRDAYLRIRAEKPDAAAGDADLVALVDARLESGRAARDAGEPVRGRALLDEGYAVLKVAIEQVRRGDTLVRTLEFASEEEEYRYEIDRNDVHRMLLDVLGRERAATNADLAARIEASLGKANALRASALESAGQGEYARAIDLLEAATAELQRAIRGAGVYIPG